MKNVKQWKGLRRWEVEHSPREGPCKLSQSPQALWEGSSALRELTWSPPSWNVLPPNTFGISSFYITPTFVLHHCLYQTSCLYPLVLIWCNINFYLKMTKHNNTGLPQSFHFQPQIVRMLTSQQILLNMFCHPFDLICHSRKEYLHRSHHAWPRQSGVHGLLLGHGDVRGFLVDKTGEWSRKKYNST